MNFRKARAKTPQPKYTYIFFFFTFYNRIVRCACMNESFCFPFRPNQTEGNCFKCSYFHDIDKIESSYTYTVILLLHIPNTNRCLLKVKTGCESETNQTTQNEQKRKSRSESLEP